jgi:hypothetical protein
LREALLFRKERAVDDILSKTNLGDESGVTLAEGSLPVPPEASSSSDSSESAHPPLDLAKYRRLRVRVFVGRDKEDRPVMFERLGEFFGAGSSSLMGEEEWIRHYIWDLERHFTAMRAASEACGKRIDQYVFFGDLQGIVSAIMWGSIWSAVPLLKALVKTVEQHYPEIVGPIVLFNVPKVAAAVYSAIKLFLDPVTAAKIEMHPGVPERLKELLGEDVIPVEYGGTNPVEYPKCATE